MENCDTIYADFGCVPCGQKATQTVKVKNRSKRVRVLAVSSQFKNKEAATERLHIQPIEVLAKPGQTVHFLLSFISYVDDVTENRCYNILNSREVVARLRVHAKSVGPRITPTAFNLKFFRFRGLDETVRHVDLTNNSKCEAKFLFDLDEDFEQINISQRTGVIPANQNLTLKLTFKPLESGIYHRKIFCIVQFHAPIIFNILAIYKPKVKVELKDLVFRYLPLPNFVNNCEAYIARVSGEKLPQGEKIRLSQKFSQEFETALKLPRISGESADKQKSSRQTSDLFQEAENKPLAEDIVLTNSYLNIKNLREVLKATALVNLSNAESFYYEWDEDPKNHFQVCPHSGVVKPNSRTYFTVNFTPSALDFIYHIELDVKVFVCLDESEAEAPQTVDLPLTFSLRIIEQVTLNWKPGSQGCGWMPQCKTTPKRLHLRPCVPGETVCGTFMLERQGHLPVTFAVVSQKERDFIVQPTLGYLSKSFQLLLVRFSSESKEPGLYSEDLKIIFNDSESCAETVKLCACVEMPNLVLGNDNSITFPGVSPGTKTSLTVKIRNPTHLFLRYEFAIPTDITWVEINYPTGSIEPKASGSVVFTFKPNESSEYLDYIPCFVSSVSDVECTQTVNLRLIGSCQFGCLAATPSVYDFGKCKVGESKSVKIHLFNFSTISLNFQLRPVLGDFPLGCAEEDVTVTPKMGNLPGKGSMEIQVKVKAHSTGPFLYGVDCHIVNENVEGSCQCPRRIFSLEFEGVFQATQVIGVSINNGGPLFSPHWLWKMLDVDRMNKAFRSVQNRHTVKLTVPERMQDSKAVILSVLFEADRYGDIIFNFRAEVNCPCLEGSTRTFTEDLECMHTKAVFLPVTPHKLSPKTRLIAQITLKYEDPSECEVDIIVSSLHKTVTLKIPVVVLPAEKPSHVSFFTDGQFHLKPIFIGDPFSPLQLFWMYNNTKHATSYILNRKALWQSTSPERKVFDCVNPCGIVPPFSTVPLGFVFQPNASKDYQANATICFENSKTKYIRLRGKGILSVNKFQELALEKIVLNDRVVNTEPLECSENCINIPFIRKFSHTTRLFFLKNTTRMQKWAFQWHSFHTENIFSASIKPEKGVIDPESKLLMTLYVQSFCHSTTVTASVPCDIINYSQLKEHIASTEAKKVLEKKLEDYFTITEKGTTYEYPTISVVRKPEMHHIFLTVNVNIIDSLNIDLKLSPKQQSTLEAEYEMRLEETLKCPLKSTTLESNQQLLEKLLWNILCSSRVAESVKNFENAQDYFYLQFKTETKKARAESLERLRTIPKRANIQRFLETILQEVLCKHFVPEEFLPNFIGQ